MTSGIAKVLAMRLFFVGFLLSLEILSPTASIDGK